MIVCGPQTSHSQQLQGGNGVLPVLPGVDNLAPTNVLPHVGVDSNYNDNIGADGSQTELIRLRLEN